MRHPVLFFSHGAPTLPFDHIEARDFFVGLAAKIERPEAILVLSAHWYERTPAVTAAAEPATIHDFFGFPKALYDLTYPAPGNPALAEKIQHLLAQQQIQIRLDHDRGLDHGAWNPLLLLYPQADIPILQLSLMTGGKEQAHFDLGQALAPLRDQGILIIASGGAVHNLRAVEWKGGSTPDWATGFDEWVRERITQGDHDALLNYRALMPYAPLAQPTDDHFLPLFCALGAAGKDTKGKSLHQSFAYGSLSMACYGWGM